MKTYEQPVYYKGKEQNILKTHTKIPQKGKVLPSIPNS